MKSYPSIPHKGRREYSGMWYGFDKIDGSLIRVEWSAKKGFYKFGTKHRLIDGTTPVFSEAIPLFMERYSSLHQMFSEAKYERTITFCEFFGENSFAGMHVDEPHQVLLVDLSLYRRGLVPPSELLVLGDSVPVAKLVYLGKITDEIIYKVKVGALPITREGVVFKQGGGTKRKMFKHKTREWIEALTRHCNGNEEEIRKLL